MTDARKVVLAAALALVASAAACGVRTDPIPPEDTAARAPGDFTVEARDGAAVLRWERPRSTEGGERLNDLYGFVVERRVGAGEYRPVATLDVTDNERIRTQRTFRWTDERPPLGRVEYRVRAFSEDGQPGVPTAPAFVDDGAAPRGADGADAPDERAEPPPAIQDEEEMGEFRPIPEPALPEGMW